MVSYKQLCEILRDERLPAAIVDLDAFDRNVKQLGQIINEPPAAALPEGLPSQGSASTIKKTLRLATKSIRVPDLIRRALDSGTPYQGLLCYSCEEARALAGDGFDDLLVAYPTLAASDLNALRDIHNSGKKIAIVVDCADHVSALATAMKGAAHPFRVVVDVDVSLRFFRGILHLGVRRSPVRTPVDLGLMLDEIGRHPELKCVGALAYEAQVAGLGDRNRFKPLMSLVARVIRKMSLPVVVSARRQIAQVFKDRGIEMEIFNGGGSGSLTYAAHEPWLTELSAGSGCMGSHLFDYYSNVKFEPAVFFALQAVRVSDGGFVTCQGGGYVASGDAARDKLPVPCQPERCSLTVAEGAGEVQTPVRLGRGVSVKLGDPVIFRPAKSGEPLEHFNEVFLISAGLASGRAKTYRGLGRCFF